MRSLLLAFVAAATLVLPAKADTVTVAVTAIVEHPALDACREGIKDGLAEAGYKEGENLKFLFESAQGNPATAAQIARQFVGEAPKVIVPISTPSAQAVAAATKDIATIFTAVTDPVAAQLVASLDKPGGNVSGLSDMSPLAEHIDLVKVVTPDVKKLGVIYNPDEANSVALVSRLKDLAKKEGIEIVESTATKSAEVQAAARALVGKVDALYVPTDNTVVSALEAIVTVAEQAKLPLYTADTDSVARGAMASIGFNYYDVGKQTAEMVVRVIKGEKTSAMPVEFASGTDLVVNKKAAAAMGVTLPEKVVKRATKVIE